MRLESLIGICKGCKHSSFDSTLTQLEKDAAQNAIKQFITCDRLESKLELHATWCVINVAEANQQLFNPLTKVPLDAKFHDVTKGSVQLNSLGANFNVSRQNLELTAYNLLSTSFEKSIHSIHEKYKHCMPFKGVHECSRVSWNERLAVSVERVSECSTCE